MSALEDEPTDFQLLIRSVSGRGEPASKRRSLRRLMTADNNLAKTTPGYACPSDEAQDKSSMWEGVSPATQASTSIPKG